MQSIRVTLLGQPTFGDLPDAHAVTGMAIIVRSGPSIA
jgi:hypothetical protein